MIWQLPNRAKYRLPKDLPSSLVVRLTVQKIIFQDLKSVVAISKFLSTYAASVGRDSLVGTVTHVVMEVVGIESLWTRSFPHPSRTALGPTQPPIQWVTGLSRGKADGTWRWPPTPSSAEIKERIVLYTYPPSPSLGLYGLFQKEIYFYLYSTYTASYPRIRQFSYFHSLCRQRFKSHLTSLNFKTSHSLWVTNCVCHKLLFLSLLRISSCVYVPLKFLL